MFHVAVPLLVFEIPQIKKFKSNRFALIIGSLLPDIIDKIILLLGIGNGRGFAHNLLFMFISFAILFLITKGNRNVTFPFLVGLGFHLILDLPYVPLLFPFIQYDFPVVEEPLWYWFNTLFTDPLVLMTELIGIGIFIFILINNRLYHRKDIIYYLKGTIELPDIEKIRN